MQWCLLIKPFYLCSKACQAKNTSDLVLLLDYDKSTFFLGGDDDCVYLWKVSDKELLRTIREEN